MEVGSVTLVEEHVLRMQEALGLISGSKFNYAW